MSLVSIIVTIYNVESYIQDCLNSIINQTYPDIEIVLIDDGSVDNTSAICEKYQKKYSQIKYYYKKNGGVSSARNYGLKIANGKYISFVDADDTIEPNMIEELVNNLENTKSDISLCGHFREEKKEINVIAFDEKQTIDKNQALYYLISDDTRIENYPWDKLYKRELFIGIEYPVGKKYEDAYTTYKLFLKSKQICITNLPLYHYRIRENSITTTVDLQGKLDLYYAYIDVKKGLNNYLNLAKLVNKRILDCSLDLIYFIERSAIYNIAEFNYLFAYLKKNLIEFITTKNIMIKRKIVLVFICCFPKTYFKVNKLFNKIIGYVK